MGFFDRIKDSVSLAGAGVGQKVSYKADVMKLNNQIRSNDKEVEKLIYQVGEKCVKLHLEDETSEYAELFAQIRKLRSENAAIEEEIHRLGVELEEQERLRQQEMQEKQAQRERERREREELARQQAAEAQEAEFTELKEEEAENPDETQKVCPGCGERNDADALFCVYCGAPFPEQKPETDASDAVRPGAEEPEAEEPGADEAEENVLEAGIRE